LLMQVQNARELRGRIQYGLITIRPDEARAVLRRLPFDGRILGTRTYDLAALQGAGGDPQLIAHIRCRGEQGPTEARLTAQALIYDLAPKYVLLIGIAGTVPNEDVTLGDVVVSNYIYDIRVGANKPGGKRDFAFRGYALHQDARDFIGRLPAIERELGDWAAQSEIGSPRPLVTLENPSTRGSKDWQKKILVSLQHHFGPQTHRTPAPIVRDVAFASGAELVKDPELVEQWLRHARDLKAVEMELVGAHEACGLAPDHDPIPLISIRGISDVVGLEREPAWTEYACESAGAFTAAILKHGILRPTVDIPAIRQRPLQPATSATASPAIECAYGHPYRHTVDDIVRAANRRNRGQTLALLGPPGLGKSLILRDVVNELSGIRTCVWLSAAESSLDKFDSDLLEHVSGVTADTTFDDLASWQPPLFVIVDGFQAYFGDTGSVSPDAYRVWPARLRALTVDRFAVVVLCGSIDAWHLYEAYGLRNDLRRGSWNLTPQPISLRPDYSAWLEHLTTATGQTRSELSRLATLAEGHPVALMSALDAAHLGLSPAGAIMRAHSSYADEIMHTAPPCCRTLLRGLAQASGSMDQVAPELADCAIALEAAGFITRTAGGLRLAVSAWARRWEK
jgi:nucleoside phosphorylase